MALPVNWTKVTVRNGGADWRREILSKDLAGLNRATTRGKLLANAAIVLLQEDETFEMAALEAAYDHAHDVLKTGRARRDGAA